MIQITRYPFLRLPNNLFAKKMGDCMDKERHCKSQAFSSALTRHKINANLEIIHWLNKNLHMIQMCRKHELKKPEKKCKLKQN